MPHRIQMKAVLPLFLALQLCNSGGYALVHNTNNYASRRFTTEVTSASYSLLPSHNKRTTTKVKKQPVVAPASERYNEQRNTGDDTATGVFKKPGISRNSMPDKIPRLSDLMKGSTLDDFADFAADTSNTNSKDVVPKPQPTKKPYDRPSRPSPQVTNSGKKQSRSSSADPTTKEPTKHVEPWRASFKASIRTQGRIKKAFSSSTKGQSPNEKAKQILQALLLTPPHQCNAANIVCALTFSAKALGNRRIEPDKELRRMLFQTLDALRELVQDHLLTTRQLCNACWAIAKHYDRDSSLLPSPPEATALSSESVVGKAETWNMKESSGKEKACQQRVDETVDEIARQLTSVLEEEESEDTGDDYLVPLKAKIGEICMTSWAYGKLRHRQTPPGWQVPPQLGRLPTNLNNNNKAKELTVTTNLITFERWDSFGDKKKEKEATNTYETEEVTGKLFDAIGASLCRSPESFGVDDYEYQDEDDGYEYQDHESDEVKRYRTCLSECKWSELANVGWSFASHGSCKSLASEMLLLGLSREARHRLKVGGEATRGLLIRDIAQLLWALGTLQADNFRLADDLVYLVEALSEHLRLASRNPFGRGRILRPWTCADLVQVALSLAHARIDELPLLRALYEESNYRLTDVLQEDSNEPGERHSFRPWEVSILLWAQARLYLKNPEGMEFEDFAFDAPKYFLNALQNEGQSLESAGIGPQEQANVVWSLTVLEQVHSAEAIELVSRIFQEAADACQDQETIQLEHAHQLWQAYFLLQEESPEAVENVPVWFSEYLEDKWTLEKARDKLSSARHRALSQTLQFMGVEHYNEHDEDIDVAIVLKGNAVWTHETDTSEEAGDRVLVAVEFDGPNHFTREREPKRNKRPAQPRALGHTVLKYRLLKKQGWTVVRVPYYEFDKIPFWSSMVSPPNRDILSPHEANPDFTFSLRVAQSIFSGETEIFTTKAEDPC
jgi:hypothetical protein